MRAQHLVFTTVVLRPDPSNDKISRPHKAPSQQQQQAAVNDGSNATVVEAFPTIDQACEAEGHQKEKVQEDHQSVKPGNDVPRRLDGVDLPQYKNKEVEQC